MAMAESISNSRVHSMKALVFIGAYFSQYKCTVFFQFVCQEEKESGKDGKGKGFH
jgi:hypothetical protein